MQAQRPELQGEAMDAVNGWISLCALVAGGALAAWWTTRSAAQREASQAQQALEEARRQAQEAAAHGVKLQVQVAQLQEQLQAAREDAAEKIQLLQDARQQLSDQFRALAADVLQTNSQTLSDQNKEQLGAVLAPLKDRLESFQRKVEQVYVDEGKDRSALKQQVEHLMQLNQSLSNEARNLTQALRGSVKSQGNWGEFILERVLEASGLRRGHEYVVQDTQTSAEGQRQQPDVVIHLPEGRMLVVDAKVSLLAYERYTRAEDAQQAQVALRDHVNSLRQHVRGLSEKNYQKLYGATLDFVLLFVPVEPAFVAAVGHDAELYLHAWDRNVLLVSPSTLLFVVRTVAHLWRQEQQSKNAQDIARRGAELYDKLCAFVADLETVGARLDAAQDAYQGARRKLSQGRGNVVRQAQLLRELGVKPSKSLPKGWEEPSPDDTGDEAQADSGHRGHVPIGQANQQL